MRFSIRMTVNVINRVSVRIRVGVNYRAKVRLFTTHWFNHSVLLGSRAFYLVLGSLLVDISINSSIRMLGLVPLSFLCPRVFCVAWQQGSAYLCGWPSAQLSTHPALRSWGSCPSLEGTVHPTTTLFPAAWSQRDPPPLYIFIQMNMSKAHVTSD